MKWKEKREKWKFEELKGEYGRKTRTKIKQKKEVTRIQAKRK